MHGVGYNRATAQAEQGQLLGEYVLAAWFTLFCVSLGLEPSDPKRYVFPPLDDLAEAAYPECGLSSGEVHRMQVACVSALAILGDWEALDEIAAAAIQTFREVPG